AAPGWNQMGNPYQYPIDIGHIIVTDFTTFAGIITNASNTLTDQGIKVWSPSISQYRDTTLINGRQGFWMRCLSATNPVYLIWLPGANPQGSASPRVIAEKLGVPLSIVAGSSKASANRIASAQWSVSITGQQGGRVSEPVVMGAAAVPGGAWNPLSRGI